MSGINFKKLNEAIKDKDSKSQKAFNGDIFLSSYLTTLSNMMNKMADVNQHELGLLIKSLDKWLNDRNKINRCKEDVNIGDIFMVDWNLAYKSELSYHHPGLILALIEDLILVVPVCSKVNTISEAYHPVDNVNGNWNNRKVKISDGFDEDCVLLLDNIKTISKSRLDRKVGKIDCDLKKNDTLFQEIKNSIIEHYFPHEYNIYVDVIKQLKREKNAKAMLHSHNDKLYNDYLVLTIENEQLKQQMAELLQSKSS